MPPTPADLSTPWLPRLHVSRVGTLVVISTAYERTSVVVTTNLPFEQWTEVLGSERLVGATLDRLTHRCHILEAAGESYRCGTRSGGGGRNPARRAGGGNPPNQRRAEIAGSGRIAGADPSGPFIRQRMLLGRRAPHISTGVYKLTEPHAGAPRLGVP